MKLNASKRGQVAIDFLSSYGIAILIMIIAIAIAYQVSTGTRYLFSEQCIPSPGFSCGFYNLNSSGLLTVFLQQATGGEISVGGIACSSGINQTSFMPAYGNIYVTNNTNYYPPNAPPVSTIMASGTAKKFLVYCYQQGGKATAPQLGTTFRGYVWMNYTIVGTNVKVVPMVASIQIKYA